MKTARSLLITLLCSLALVSAAPLDLENRDLATLEARATTTDPDTVFFNKANAHAGAAYFITNEPKGNFVVVADLMTNGKITFSRAVATRGRGSHGVTSPNGPDPLFSQGAIKASTTGNILAAVNPGSNTVSVFSIDPKNPVSIKQIGQPVGSGGEFPMSLAINKDGNTVCVLNGGAVNGVNCFSVDQSLGLIPKANTHRSLNLNQTTPATGPAGSASHIIFSEDGGSLIASIKGNPAGSPAVGFLAVWTVASDGTLSNDFQTITAPTGGSLPFSLTNIPGKNAILATDAGIGFDVFDISMVKSGNASQLVSGRNSANAIQNQKATCWSSFSSQTGNFYVTDIGTSTVTEIKVDDNLKGTIVKQYPQTAGSATIDNDVVTLNKKDFLYVLAPNSTSVEVVSLNGSGQAKNVGTFSFAKIAQKAGVTVTPENLQGMTTFPKQT